MAPVNWIIVVGYLAVIIGIGWVTGRRQKSQDDYYLGRRRVPAWLAASSLLSNQVSAISLVSAPAFIAVRSGGGLKWLQYELAVPLAMAGIILFLAPAIRSGGVTIYEYLEKRFGRPARMVLGLLFMINRSLGAGAILLATSYVAAALMRMDVYSTVLLVGAVSLAYTAVGGIMADLYTDLVQLILLWACCIALIVLLAHLVEGPFPAGEAGRLAVYNMRATGIGDGETFSLWPMLFGGFFLYLSYYGCDQSQAQRLLATPDAASSRRALLVNGIMRFPLVATYCAVGVLMIVFIAERPEFAGRMKGLPPDYLMPLFFTRYVPDGLLGLIAVGILAASMSSLDSTVNSLSAVTWRDFIMALHPGAARIAEKKQVWISRLISLAWGTVSVCFALAIAGRSETIIELVNKIGSALYGPIAGVFLLGVFGRRAGGRAALAGLACGITVNMTLWFFFEAGVSWMWWNLTGCAAAFFTGMIAGRLAGGEVPTTGAFPVMIDWKGSARSCVVLVVWFIVIAAACVALERVLAGRQVLCPPPEYR